MPTALVLRCGTRQLPITGYPIAIGRLPECDLALDGAEISRRHARIVPTPEGPLLVDRSRFGTFLNGEQVVAPSLLSPGDVILIGRYDMVVEVVEAHLLTTLSHRSGWRQGFAAWRRRYGLAELVGTLALILAALAIQRATGSILAAALAGSLAEAGWFYGVLLVREFRLEKRDARVGGFEARALRELGRDLLLEFGAAERLDGLVLRPLCLGLGLLLMGGWLGLLVGKIVADLLFYGPILSLFHWRNGDRPGGGGGGGDDGNPRQTSATGFPLMRQ
jgi:FHA domain